MKLMNNLISSSNELKALEQEILELNAYIKLAFKNEDNTSERLIEIQSILFQYKNRISILKKKQNWIGNIAKTSKEANGANAKNFTFEKKQLQDALEFEEKLSKSLNPLTRWLKYLEPYFLREIIQVLRLSKIKKIFNKASGNQKNMEQITSGLNGLVKNLFETNNTSYNEAKSSAENLQNMTQKLEHMSQDVGIYKEKITSHCKKIEKMSLWDSGEKKYPKIAYLEIPPMDQLVGVSSQLGSEHHKLYRQNREALIKGKKQLRSLKTLFTVPEGLPKLPTLSNENSRW